MPKNFVGPHCSAVLQKFSGSEKFLDKVGGGGGIKTFRRKFLFSHCRKVSYGNRFVQCFRNFPVAKKLTDKGGGGLSRFSVEKFFSHSAEKFLRGIFYCFINFRYRKMLGIREGETRYFFEKNSSPSAEKLCRGTLLFCVSEIFRWPKVYG